MLPGEAVASSLNAVLGFKSLKVDLDNGIPAAAFLASDGTSIGTTNNGELEASRDYHSEMILHFLHQVVENHKIVKPQ